MQAEIPVAPASSAARSASPRGHLPTLDALRGIASLAVCWFHYTNAEFTEQFPRYQATGKYGWLGVHIFFVISGFVIPLSMYRARYQIAAFFRFMLKRIARLDPPYLASVALVVLGTWLSSLLPGHVPYHIPWAEVAAHLGYLNAFLGMNWMQMTYWSLAIEFQYYLFVGLCFPLLAWNRRVSPVLILGLFGVLTLLAGKSEALLPHYLPLFAMGVLTFRHECLKVRRYDAIASLLVAFGLAVWIDGWLQASVALTACLVIRFVHIDNPVLNFFGRISYSLYLLHAFLGNILFGLAIRWAGTGPFLQWSLQFIILLVAIGAAYVFYRLVELPSRALSGRISYKVR